MKEVTEFPECFVNLNGITKKMKSDRGNAILPQKHKNTKKSN